ncbi:hypothetical protein KAR91_48320 [Candidatus Pacearchaeota archaeon]|nr:hypothetical protein [Candidatus Pacearchaeota archaeon]
MSDTKKPEEAETNEAKRLSEGLCSLIDELEEKREWHKAKSESGNVYVIGQHEGRRDAYKYCIDKMMLLKKKRA